ncbi:hypothetical protein N8T08_009341 [Aspergillus melleus]|uniref:Uncharacterized protein n=1 Tax=Aspergillus melleus TaxID=138277 RepID=A0ACC3AUW6_9EURO|nr:hypothetical protein N8T08_009341 [Aspergillus melleus]
MLQTAYVATTGGWIRKLRATASYSTRLVKSWSGWARLVVLLIRETDKRTSLVHGARAVWKPDLTTLTNTGFDQYLNWCTQECGFGLADQGWLRLAGALDLACHQRCRSNILELGHQPGFSEVVRALLRAGTSFRRYNSYSRGVFCNGDLVETADEQKPESSTAIQERKFDIVIVQLQSR